MALILTCKDSGLASIPVTAQQTVNNDNNKSGVNTLYIEH